MEDLTKQQIVLLTLFVSFVTSIATGIVAVSLMNQAPTGVTQTINQIVERTIERVSDATSTASVADAQSSAPTIPEIVANVSKSIVRLKSRNASTTDAIGMGIVLSKEGVIVTDKSNTSSGDLVAVFSDGREFPVQVIQSQILGDIVFLAVMTPSDYHLYPVTYENNSASNQLGETLLTLGGKDSNILDQGLLSKTQSKPDENIETTISSKNILAGSPLFTTEGNVVGIKTASLLPENSFYPLGVLKSIIPIISR